MTKNNSENCLTLHEEMELGSMLGLDGKMVRSDNIAPVKSNDIFEKCVSAAKKYQSDNPGTGNIEDMVLSILRVLFTEELGPWSQPEQPH